MSIEGPVRIKVGILMLVRNSAAIIVRDCCMLCSEAANALPATFSITDHDRVVRK